MAFKCCVESPECRVCPREKQGKCVRDNPVTSLRVRSLAWGDFFLDTYTYLQHSVRALFWNKHMLTENWLSQLVARAVRSSLSDEKQNKDKVTFLQ